MTAEERRLRRALRRAARSARAKANAWFFKTGPGDYGEGDRFLGLTVPQVRTFARTHQDLPHAGVVRLLRSRWHEERLLALLIWLRRYSEHPDARNQIHAAYLRHTAFVNNWDLVDCSASLLVGAHLQAGNRRLLARLAKSRSLWERRIAMIGTFHYIRRDDYKDALKIAEALLDDSHDLIHKAVGWMLREVGKRNRAVEERFLKKHAAVMPRTMLRYAIERFPASTRRRYLAMRTR